MCNLDTVLARKGSTTFLLKKDAADDLVLMADKEEEMRSMIERLEKYLEGKGLELNIGKTKIIRFRKGGGRRKKRNGDGRER